MKYLNLLFLNRKNKRVETKLPKVLVIDDEQSYLQTITNELSGSFEILHAPNGRLGCKVARKECPDLIIMDWEMPEMNGIAAIKELQSDEETKQIPVIMCTGVMTSSENLQLALETGAIDYIRKPVDILELKARINSVLQLADSFATIKKQNQALEELQQEQNALMGIVAHDLRSPISQMLNLNQILMELPCTPEEEKQYKKTFNEVALRALKLIERLMLVSEADSGSDFKIAVIDLNSFLKPLLRAYEPQLLNRKMVLHNNITAGVKIKADSAALTRVFDNLITNAMKFSPKGTSISISAKAVDKEVEIAVADQGVGIPEADKPKLFKRFAKLSPQALHSEDTSNGLGLSIVKLLTERMKGRVRAESKVNKGTTFYVTLPSA